MIPAGGYSMTAAAGRRVFAAAAADPLPGVRACGCLRVSRACLRKSCPCKSFSPFLVLEDHAENFSRKKQAIKNGGKNRRFDVYFILIF